MQEFMHRRPSGILSRPSPNIIARVCVRKFRMEVRHVVQVENAVVLSSTYISLVLCRMRRYGGSHRKGPRALREDETATAVGLRMPATGTILKQVDFEAHPGRRSLPPARYSYGSKGGSVVLFSSTSACADVLVRSTVYRGCNIPSVLS